MQDQETPSAETHPNLILTRKGVQQMQARAGKIPLFDQSVATIQEQVDGEINGGIAVPVPKDLAGGYTHERHKANFFTMQKAGVLFQITGEDKYATYIKDMLIQYAEMYPTLSKHPATRSYARGKFFWQCLNDANWLVYTSQAYDCIYDWLDENTVKKLNEELFRPYAEYISIENPQFFNRIHNHSTWGNAGVGMIGLVMNDEELVKWALYGLDQQVPRDILKDNDGGEIQLKGQKEAGFLEQLDHAFSPDGYYTEGAYYQRYAMYPFLIFSQGLVNKMPELDILNYRDGLLIKAVYALINQTNAVGEFFPINDAQKGMSLASRELVYALSMAFHFGGNDPQLLSLIKKQGRVPLNDSGLSAAQAIATGGEQPFEFKSIKITDGASGEEGAIGILRSGSLTLVLKNAKHGMGHGHFDRLGFLLYNGDQEVFQDYGSSRWVNIEHKDGGGYLKENKSWAKQSIAHNSIVINKHTQFGSKVQNAEDAHGYFHFFDVDNPDFQVMAAVEPNAYPGWRLHRTLAMIQLPDLENPLVLDLLSAMADKDKSIKATFDLPLYYLGEWMSSNVNVQVEETLQPLGERDGYQHLWKEAEAASGEIFKMTWFNASTFYSLTAASDTTDKVYFTRIGANDPNFNLRRDPGIILSRNSGSTLFAQTYEVHGAYDPASEIPLNSFSSVASIQIVHHSAAYNMVEIKLTNGKAYLFASQKESNNENEQHSIDVGGEPIKWKGNFILKDNSKNE